MLNYKLLLFQHFFLEPYSPVIALASLSLQLWGCQLCSPAKELKGGRIVLASIRAKCAKLPL